jgi:Domain of unknown function (DUF932)
MVSSRFVNIDNKQLIEKALNSGYTLDREFKGGFVLRDSSFQFNGLIPTIKIYNENDGKSSLKLKLGVFRLACANGLLVTDDIDVKRVIHIGKKPLEFMNDFIKELVALRDQYEEIKSSVANMNKIMERNAQRLFAYNMIKARGLKLKTNEKIEEVIDLLLICRRPEDSEETIFNIINRVQENLTRHFNPEIKMKMKLRLLKNEEKLDQLNQNVWNIALKVA